jgi:type VI protein secretion system component Hcp
MGAKPAKEVPTHFVSRAKKHLIQDEDDEEVPQREMVESWIMDEVADEFDERQLPHVAEKIAEREARGIDLFSFEREDLVDIGLTEEDIEKFLTMQTISMSHQEATDTAARLYANTKLTKVGAKATMEQGSNVAGALTLGHGLQVGELVRIESSIEGEEEFFELMKVDASGQSVTLSSSFKGHDGDMGIFRAVRYLALGYKQFHNAAFFRITKALAKNKTVTGVDLRFNKLNDVAAEKMLEVLAENQRIISCEMMGNKDQENTAVSDEVYGQIAVQCALNIMEHKHLMTLDLRQQRIDDAALKPLVEALLTNTTITSVNLSLNRLADEGFLQVQSTVYPQYYPY